MSGQVQNRKMSAFFFGGILDTDLEFYSFVDHGLEEFDLVVFEKQRQVTVALLLAFGRFQAYLLSLFDQVQELVSGQFFFQRFWCSQSFWHSW